MKKVDRDTINITADFFGEIRFIDLFKDYTKASEDELFFSIERRDKDGNYIPQRECGFITETPEMKEFIHNEFFTGCSGIKFIEWEDEWNVVFPEKTIIGNISLKMSFEEFNKLFPVKEPEISTEMEM